MFGALKTVILSTGFPGAIFRLKVIYVFVFVLQQEITQIGTAWKIECSWSILKCLSAKKLRGLSQNVLFFISQILKLD